jgi:prolyl 4-hydroxylase
MPRVAEQRFTEDVLPSLVEWFDFNVAAGCTAAQLRQILVESGYAADEVETFLSAQFARRGDALDVAEDPIGRVWRKLDVLGGLNRVSVGDRTVRALVKSPPHGLYLFADFLSAEECDALIAIATPHLKPSNTIDEVTGGGHVNLTRSSQGAGLPRGATELGRRIEARIATLTATPASHGESLQLLRYDLGGEYLPHFDFFEPGGSGGADMIANGAQRLATVIMYLTDGESGGGTIFPELNLEITPLRGAALLFPSIDRGGAVMRTSLHAGAAVTSGQKWIATKWLRTRPFGAA